MLNQEPISVLNKRHEFRASEFLFPSPRDGPPPRDCIQIAWRRIRRKADLPGALRLQDLRKTYASTAILTRARLYMTCKLHCHCDPQSTGRYAYLPVTTLQAASMTTSTIVEKPLAGVWWEIWQPNSSRRMAGAIHLCTDWGRARPDNRKALVSQQRAASTASRPPWHWEQLHEFYVW